MSSPTDSVQPPRAAVWLVTLFSPAGNEPIAGDLLEEFSRLASEKGITHARHWYWRQAITSIPYLLAAGFRGAPWTVAAIVTGVFLLRWFVSVSSGKAIHGAIDSVLSRNLLYERDPEAYLFWLTTSLFVVRLIVNVLAGAVVAVTAKGREMTATVTLGLAGIVLAIHATVLTIATTGDSGVMWTLPHTFAFSIAIVVAGAVVRMYRARAATLRPVP
jgi:hypothetical protein